MRNDIEIHINTGDIVISPQNKSKFYSFDWVENSVGLTRYIYGEIQLPGSISEASIRNDGVYFEIPYTPKYKEFYIRIRRVFSDDISMFVQNPVDGSEWFLARVGLYGSEMKNSYASQLFIVSEDKFYVKLNREYADIYSGNESDVNIIPAQRQNANLLLKCVPTNNYRYPLTGVGLMRWVNSNINNSGLAEILKKEFEDDGVIVESASFDMESKDLKLNLNEQNID